MNFNKPSLKERLPRGGSKSVKRLKPEDLEKLTVLKIAALSPDSAVLTSVLKKKILSLWMVCRLFKK